jgi:hypothetical protein
MPSVQQLLEQHAERCIQLAYQCRNKKAERFLRQLAVDLALAAEQQRPLQREPAPQRAFTDMFSELERLSNAAGYKLRTESASTI